MAFLAINIGKLFTKTVETRQRFSFVHVSLGTADEKACSLVQDRPNTVLYLLLYKAKYKHSLKYSRNNASLSVNVKVAYFEGVDSAVCFMTVVLFPSYMKFSLSSQCPYRFWYTFSPLCSGHPCSSLGSQIIGERSCQLTSNTGAKNAWSFASTP
jgi:hypothetical protein